MNAAASAAVRGTSVSNGPTRSPISSLLTPLTVVRLITSRTPRIAAICRDSWSMVASVSRLNTSPKTPTTEASSLPKTALTVS